MHFSRGLTDGLKILAILCLTALIIFLMPTPAGIL